MADPWNAAWEEAEASAPPGLVVYNTIELQHPEFVEDEIERPVRVVADVAEDQVLGIEAGALFDGGKPALFMAVQFWSEDPDFAEGRMPECMVTIDNAVRTLVPLIEAAVRIRADLKCLFRQYRSDMRDEPCYGPVEFVMRKVTVTGTRVSGIARLDDLANAKFPRKVYTISEFPGLQT